MIPEVIMRGVFLRGAFTEHAALAAASVLTAYGFGLLAIVLIRSVVASFQAIGDTRTPMLISLVAVACNIVLKLMLFKSMGAAGLAAATAEVIFTAHQHIETAQEFYRDIKARARGLGRNPDHILVMPGVAPFVGRTKAEAEEKYDRLTSYILEADGVGLLNGLTGGTLDLRGYDLDGPLPPAPPR